MFTRRIRVFRRAVLKAFRSCGKAVLALLLVLCCGSGWAMSRSAEPASEDTTLGEGVPQLSSEETAASEVPNVELSWSLARSEDGQSLVISYTIANQSEDVIYFCDELLLQQPSVQSAGERLVVRRGQAPGHVEFVCGAVSPREALYTLIQPTVQKLEPGQMVRIERRLPYPLQAWHNVGTLDPLDAGLSHARLVLYYHRGEPVSWRPLGAEAQVGDFNNRWALHGEALALP